MLAHKREWWRGFPPESFFKALRYLINCYRSRDPSHILPHVLWRLNSIALAMPPRWGNCSQEQAFKSLAAKQLMSA